MKLGKTRNPKYTEISLYVICTVIIIYILSKIADHTGDILSFVFRGLHTVGIILTPLLIGFVIAYLLYPVVQFLRRRLSKLKYYARKGKDPKAASVALTYLLLVVGLVVSLSVLISIATREVFVLSFSDLTVMLENIGKSLQTFYEDLQNWLDSINVSSDQVKQIVNTISGWFGTFVSNLGNSFVHSLSNVTSVLANTIFAVILSIYFLLDAENLTMYWDKVLKALSPKRFYALIHRVIADADFVFSGYIRGQLIDAAFMAIMISVSLSVVGVRFAVPIGILAGIGNLIPYVGPFVAYGLTAAVCIIGGDIRKLVIALIILFIIQTIDGNVINPKLLSSNTNVHPMLVIVALLFGSAVGGILGMLLAVPVAALLKIWFDRIIEKLIRKRESLEKEQLPLS